MYEDVRKLTTIKKGSGRPGLKGKFYRVSTQMQLTNTLYQIHVIFVEKVKGKSPIGRYWRKCNYTIV